MSRRLQPARRSYRFVRKKAKRAWSHVWLAGLRLRNRLSSAPVLGEVPVVVSLTSYGSRIDTVAYAVESIAAGRARPQRLILWLDDPHQYDDRPAALRRLEARGLDVRLTENLGPHKKYFPALPIALDDGVALATADDDTLYPRYWLARLAEAARRHPQDIHCYRASVVRLDGDRLAPYDRWPRCQDTVGSLARFATGVSGVWYPPAMLAALRHRGTEFLRYVPRADDIWLHWVAVRSGIRVRQLSRLPRHFPYIPGTQTQTLVQENVAGGGNDRLLAGLYEASDIATLAGALAEEDGAASRRGIAGAAR
ncbi:MAG TPA: glycosyltransferase family A protein [Propionibacteriaceae bacterium]|jgi:hypothetical protein|nr:glycosyltransferase family A protein [Propionibacteriaceae bacterium]